MKMKIKNNKYFGMLCIFRFETSHLINLTCIEENKNKHMVRISFLLLPVNCPGQWKDGKLFPWVREFI